MILFAGIPSEPPIALAIEAAQQAGVAYAVLNQRHVRHYDMYVESDATGVRGNLWIGERLWPLDAFTGIYARTVEVDTLPEFRPQRGSAPDVEALAHARFLSELFTGWLEIATACVANRPSAMATNISKPFQTQLISESGFLIPPTLVTNDAQAVREFRQQHGRIIFKSISAVRSIVTEWQPEDEARLDRLRALPTQFQALLEGTNFRVHVVGGSAFACEIVSKALDYRYAAREELDIEMRPAALPREVEERCIRMTESLGLVISGIDLLRTHDGRWFCFEVNTSPGYSYFQDQTGLPIAQALVACLNSESA